MIFHQVQNPQKYNKQKNSCYLSFVDCGLIYAAGNWMHKKRFLDKYELIYVTQGVLYLLIDTAPVTLFENDLIIVPPYKTICGSKESVQQTTFFWADFLTDDAENFEVAASKIHISQTSKFINLLEELVSTSQQKDTRDYTKDALLLLLFHEMKKNGQENSPQRFIVSKISAYIEANITKPLTAETVADALNYHKDYLCRIIKACFGISLKDYINKQKINLAKKLLTASNYTIKEISNYLGYDDSNLFIKFFKYHEKISPLQYRNHHN